MATISIGCSVPGCNFNTPEVAKHFYPNMVDQLKVPPSKWSYCFFYWRHLEIRTNLNPQLHLWSCHNDGNMRKIIWSRHAVNSSSLGLNINMQVRRTVVNYQFEARESMCWWWGVCWAFLGLRHLLKTACHFKITTTDLVLAILRSGQQYTHCVNFGWFSPILALVFFSSNTNCLHL